MSSTPIAAARRRTELGLIVMAATITGVAYTLASLGQNAVIPPILVPFLIAVLGLLVVAHLANRGWRKVPTAPSFRWRRCCTASAT